MPYGRTERLIARMLDSAPQARARLKTAYQRVNYLLHGLNSDPVRLHPNVSVERVASMSRDDQASEHFFGYFGVSPWSADGRYYILHRWTPGNAKSVEVCVSDLKTGQTRRAGSSCAWNFQQGAMAQWWSGSANEAIIFNTVSDRRLVTRIIDLDFRQREIPWPIQALRPGSDEGVSINYRRLMAAGSEYGYDVEVDNFSPAQEMENDGIWRVNLIAGTGELIISLRLLRELHPTPEMEESQHKVNHVLYSPGGSRFIFMHRWLGPRGKYSRLYCADADGRALRMLLDFRMVSHCAWKDDRTIVAWARAPREGDRYYLIDVVSGECQILGRGTLDRFGDGHPSFSPDGSWLVTDSYPDRARMRRLLLYHLASGSCYEAAAFFAPWHYNGPVRCDLHPRWSRDGRLVSVDSAHEGRRNNYLINVSRILASDPRAVGAGSARSRVLIDFQE